MRGTWGTGLTVVLALALVIPARSASAQVSLGPANLDGDVEAGVRLLPERPAQVNREKFEEYRDITQGLFLANLQLRVFTPDEKYSLEALGSKWGQQDQEFGFRVSRLGLWKLGFSWDEIPHVYSTMARTLESESGRAEFTLPTPRPPLSAYNAGRRLDEVGVRWDTAKLSFSITPTPDLELRADYTRIHKDGERPIGMVFGGPASNLLETLEPIDQTIHDLRLRANVRQDGWQLQFGYALSMFENANSILTADNPCFGLPAPVTAPAPGCGADGVGAQPTGGLSLAPSNQAHNWKISGGVDLPLHTRISASVAYGLRLQNADFLGQTVNPALVSPLLGLPAGSLDGKVATTLVSLQAVTRPLVPLTLTAKYRYYDYNDFTKELVFSGRVLNDRFVLAESVKALRPDYTKQNADLDARWRFGSPLAVTVGAGWERWDRNDKVREVPSSDEISGKVVVDYTPSDWLMAHLSYRPSFRRIDEYNTWAHFTSLHLDQTTPALLTANQSLLLRKFDEGERDRQRIDLLLQLVPSERLSGTINVGWKNDDYIRSPLGLQLATSWSAGADVTFVPFDRFSIVAGYVREWIFEKQRSRSGPEADTDWISDNADTIDTVHLGVKAQLTEALDWTLGANYSTATGTVRTRNPGPITSQTILQVTGGNAKRFPAFVDSLLRLDTALRYHFRDNWTASLGYIFETFGQHDWRTDTLNPFMPALGSSIFLGNNPRGYDAHIVALTLGYRFR